MIALGCDHGGYELMQEIKKYLDEKGLEYQDFGCGGTKSVDYPVYARKVTGAIVSGQCERGILICGTGIGISIAANKVKGVRCGLCTSVEMATLTKQHNNANILALGGRTTAPELAMEIVDAWLDTEFEGGRHQRRVDMLDNM